MPPSKELVQHWILNTSIEFPRKLSDFVPFVESESLNVVPIPGANSDDYARVFLSLLDTGLIQAFITGQDRENETNLDREGVEAIIEQRLKLPRISSRVRVGTDEPKPLKPAPDLRWKMTSLGGDAWENLAKPDWNRYALTLTDVPPTSPLTGDIWSANRDLLMAELGWSRELGGMMIDRDTVKVETVHDHPITYWKVLPLVYHATYSAHPAPDCWPGRNPWDKPEWFQAWWKSLNEWYKKPWDLQGWPVPEKR